MQKIGSTLSGALLLVPLLLPSCVTMPSSLPDEKYLVVVKSVQLPDREWIPWYTRFAEHCWVDWRDESGWWRAEWNQYEPDVAPYSIEPEVARADTRWGMGVQVHSVQGGEDAKRVGAAIHGRAREFPYAGCYQGYPGPNSNTFVAWLARECDIHVELPPTAMGEHYVAIARAGLTTTGTGVLLDTYAFGLEVGLQEGAAVHLFGLPFGVGLWPPAIKLPFLPAIPFGWQGRGSVATGERPSRLSSPDS